MDQILEKWDEILMTVKTEHDISDIAFNTFLWCHWEHRIYPCPVRAVGTQLYFQEVLSAAQSSNHRDHRNRIRDKVHSSGTGEVDRFFS